VGGVSLLNSDVPLRTFERRSILNRGGEFHLFDRRASGVILGEGAGMTWLKTVDRALSDGDTIYGVVKAVAINNDGRTAGPAAPNIQAQKAVMKRALEKCGKQAEEISYVEVNGSGTEVTDLLELKAIESVYRSATKAPCELGSMKPNIGHPLCAEGIASFIKCVLMLHHRRKVPFLSAQQPMRHYDWTSSPFYFSRTPSETGTGHRTVAINCFADGGTNAHVIIDAWHETRSKDHLRRPIEMPRLRKVELNGPLPSGQFAVSIVAGTNADGNAPDAHLSDTVAKIARADLWELVRCAESTDEVVHVDFWGPDRKRPRQADAR
jgi:polyketide synthase PksJ/polyketide synthase PksN